MKMSNAPNAAVSREKIVDYLLNPAHPDNGGKAEFFTELGFRREQWEILATALKNLVLIEEVTRVSESPHGKKYVVVGRIQSPSGKTPMVQTIWIVDKGLDTARLVTAYPCKE
jgi:Domain of unknown function (DUF6883)